MVSRTRISRAAQFLLCVTAIVLVQSTASGGDQWIVVTPPGLDSCAQPLREHRRGEGFEVSSISLHTLQATTRAETCAALRDELHKRSAAQGGTSYVLLLGATAGAERDFIIPAFSGNAGRMQGEPTDRGYTRSGDASLKNSAAPRFVLGRLPARDADEARAMIAKTLRFESATGNWQDRLTLLVGNPGGRSAIERQFAEMFLQSIGTRRLQQLHPRWRIQALFHSRSSPFGISDERLAERSLQYLRSGQLWSIYLGHSGPQGLWSDSIFLHRDDWATLNMDQGCGVLFTCGCFGCQLDETAGGVGYGLAAIRNPRGPAAVIGAHGESYAAIGQLAFDGLGQLLAKPDPPQRLGSYWHAIQQSIAAGPMNPLTFYLYDQADGSRGQVPLADQRREHLEMWMLLGDPALKLPLAPLTISLEAHVSDRTLSVKGNVPQRFADTTVTLTLERKAGSDAAGLEPLVEDPAEQMLRMDRNQLRANQFVLATSRPMCDGRVFCGRLTIPDDAPWERYTVRARCMLATETALGIADVSLPPPRPSQ